MLCGLRTNEAAHSPTFISDQDTFLTIWSDFCPPPLSPPPARTLTLINWDRSLSSFSDHNRSPTRPPGSFCHLIARSCSPFVHRTRTAAGLQSRSLTGCLRNWRHSEQASFSGPRGKSFHRPSWLENEMSATNFLVFITSVACSYSILAWDFARESPY